MLLLGNFFIMRYQPHAAGRQRLLLRRRAGIVLLHPLLPLHTINVYVPLGLQKVLPPLLLLLLLRAGIASLHPLLPLHTINVYVAFNQYSRRCCCCCHTHKRCVAAPAAASAPAATATALVRLVL
jgi:hypothetical protein